MVANGRVYFGTGKHGGRCLVCCRSNEWIFLSAGAELPLFCDDSELSKSTFEMEIWTVKSGGFASALKSVRAYGCR